MQEVTNHRLSALEATSKEHGNMLVAIEARQSQIQDVAREERAWRETFSGQFHDFRVEQAASTKKQFLLLYVLILIIPVAFASLHIGGH